MTPRLLHVLPVYLIIVSTIIILIHSGPSQPFAPTSVQTAPLSTADWKTYSSQYSYSVSYPPASPPRQISDTDYLDHTVFGDPLLDNALWFSVTVRRSTLAEEVDFVKWQSSHALVTLVSEQNFEFNGYPATRLDYQPAPDSDLKSTSFVIIHAGDFSYTLSSHPDHTDTILSTFKFLSDTTNWKTYNNEKYQYSFKYPPDLTIGNGTDPESAFSHVDNVFLIDNKGNFLTIFHEENPTSLSAHNWLNTTERGNIYNYNNSTSEVKNIGGLTWYLFTPPLTFSLDSSAFTWGVFHNTDIYLVGNKTQLTNNAVETLLSTFKFTAPAMTKVQAENLVRTHPEVKDLLAKYPRYLVEAESYSESDYTWVVHVFSFDASGTLTATFNYYQVDANTEKVTPLN